MHCDICRKNKPDGVGWSVRTGGGTIQACPDCNLPPSASDLERRLRELVGAVKAWEKAKWTGDLGAAGRAAGELFDLAAEIDKELKA